MRSTKNPNAVLDSPNAKTLATGRISSPSKTYIYTATTYLHKIKCRLLIELVMTQLKLTSRLADCHKSELSTYKSKTLKRTKNKNHYYWHVMWSQSCLCNYLNCNKVPSIQKPAASKHSSRPSIPSVSRNLKASPQLGIKG